MRTSKHKKCVLSAFHSEFRNFNPASVRFARLNKMEYISANQSAADANDVIMPSNASSGDGNMTSVSTLYVSASDQKFRDIVNVMEVYWIPIIFVLGE